MARSRRSSQGRALLAAGVALSLIALRASAQTDEVPLCPSVAAAGSAPAPNNVRVVTGAPYSALGTSETVTTLPDGNRIVRENRVRLWRDSDGRTRSEFSLSSIAGPTPLELNTTVTVIDDPAARERYMLQPSAKVAVTVPIQPCMTNAGGDPDVTVGPPRPARLQMRMSPPVNLGERTVNGEKATGSRVEATIPAGAYGNKQAIQMSAEQWYGRDLQVVVEATYKDPRTGETRYRLSDIRRDEPDAKLFQVPENYTRENGDMPNIREKGTGHSKDR